MNELRNIYHQLSQLFCEPTTAITDFMLAGFCLWCFFRLYGLKTKKAAIVFWSYFLLFVGGSTFMGGLAHSFSCLSDTIYYEITWLFMQLFSGLSLFYAQSAVYLIELTKNKKIKVLRMFAAFQLFVFSISVIVFMDFRVVALNSFIGLIQLLVLSFPIGLKDWEYKTLITLGLLTSFITIYVNRTKMSIAHWFNHNDISHVFIFISLLLIYKGVRYKNNHESFFNHQ